MEFFLMSSIKLLNHMKEVLKILYPGEDVNKIFGDLKSIMSKYENNETILAKRKKYNDQIVLNEDDAILITYADSIQKKGEKPLCTLHRVLTNHVKSAVTCVHILPFFPSSSDGGFSVIDYRDVDPEFGSWEDIRNIGKDYRLMADLVMNHVSSRSEWFQGFLRGDERYCDYFLSYDEPMEMPEVFRPRVQPLLTGFDTAMGKKYVWTTFSEDQVDLNFHNPKVTLEILDVFMFYLSQGIEIIRLDAIGYVWKEPETSCVNLPQTHDMVKLLRTVAEYIAPYTIIVTEVNFPYRYNVSYLKARHEANMAYHFSLPPLVIDSFIRQDTSILQEETKRIRQDLLFFNFLASHDGIGLLGVKEILPPPCFKGLLEATTGHGGLISYKATQQGEVPYELNITYYDAINDPSNPDLEVDIRRFMAANSIMLVDKGVPGIYIHCLLGSRNYLEGVEKSGMNRMINREKLSAEEVVKDLSDPESLRYKVLEEFLRLLNVRKEIQAFHHSMERDVLQSDRRLFVIERICKGKNLIAVVNVSDAEIKLPQYKGKTDLISKTLFEGSVAPYGVYFLQ